MTTLPSFVELMSSLGLDKHSGVLESSLSSSSSPTSSTASSPRQSPIDTTSFPTQSCSISRDHVSPSRRIARYSPYLPPFLSTRRGSLPSTSLITTEFHQPMRASSTSPRLLSSPALRRRSGTNNSTNVYGSTSDLTANTPISIYVRRKTPSISPTSPTFSDNCSPTVSPMPVSLPTVPSLFPQTIDSYPSPTPKSVQPTGDKSYHTKFLPEISDMEHHNHRFHRYTSARISTPPHLSDVNDPHNQLTEVG